MGCFVSFRLILKLLLAQGHFTDLATDLTTYTIIPFVIFGIISTALWLGCGVVNLMRVGGGQSHHIIHNFGTRSPQLRTEQQRHLLA